jgi:hypothetical protein
MGGGCAAPRSRPFLESSMTEASRPAADRMAVLRRKPQRISITISQSTYERLVSRSDLEGRSVSNLAAYLLENGLGLAEAVPSGVPRAPDGVGHKLAGVNYLKGRPVGAAGFVPDGHAGKSLF